MNSGYFDVCFRAELPTSGLPAAFGVITACNPCGEKASEAENDQATDLLRSALESSGLSIFPVTGGSLDFSHSESGYGVLFDSVQQAVAWGVRFRQEAVFWVEEGQVSLIPCDGSAAVDLGPWRLRFKN
jgi:hypothetical protein